MTLRYIITLQSKLWKN